MTGCLFQPNFRVSLTKVPRAQNDAPTVLVSSSGIVVELLVKGRWQFVTSWDRRMLEGLLVMAGPQSCKRSRVSAESAPLTAGQVVIPVPSGVLDVCGLGLRKVLN